MNKYLIYHSKFNIGGVKIIKIYLTSRYVYCGYRFDKPTCKFEPNPNVKIGIDRITKFYELEAEDDASAILIYETMADELPFEENIYAR